MILLNERLSDRKLISRGDIASAFRARDTRLDRDVFLKILHPQFAEESDLRARFEREARAAAKIDHPHLVRIYEVGEDPQEGPFMLLEWVEGETLAAKIKREGKLKPAEVNKLAQTLFSGLTALHANGILHRDVKPENILCRTDGEFKLTDFSLALLADAPKLTHHTAVVGTPAYLAPELARGKSPGERTDLFAVGVTLFESATGHNPFQADALLESLRRVREDEPDWKLLESLSSDPTLVLLIRACLEKEADNRPVSAVNAVALLAGTGDLQTILPRKNSRQNLFFIAAALFSIIVAYILWPKSEDPLPPSAMSPAITTNALEVIETKLDTTTKITPVVDSKIEPVVKKDIVGNKMSHFILQPPKEEIAQTLPDSFELYLDTTPWAHVTLAGVELGTTPLGKPLKLARGQHVFMLRNPAFPPIQAQLDVIENSRRQLQLANFVQHLEIDVEPWGEVYLDHESIGTTPLKKLLSVLPGNHTMRITHPTLPAVEKSWQAVAGDTLRLRANLQTSELAVRTGGETR